MPSPAGVVRSPRLAGPNSQLDGKALAAAPGSHKRPDPPKGCLLPAGRDSSSASGSCGGADDQLTNAWPRRPVAPTVARLYLFHMSQRTLPAEFIAPCLPTKTDKLPSGSQWSVVSAPDQRMIDAPPTAA